MIQDELEFGLKFYNLVHDRIIELTDELIDLDNARAELIHNGKHDYFTQHKLIIIEKKIENKEDLLCLNRRLLT